MNKMIGRQRASSQPNLLKYTTQALDVSIHATLCLPAHEEQPTVLRRSLLAWDRGTQENPMQGNEGGTGPRLVKSQSCCRQPLSVPHSQQQTANLPHHGRLHRQLTPHVRMAQPGSPTAASCSSSLKDSPRVLRQRSFLLIPPSAATAAASQGAGDIAGSMSSCSGLSSELTNAIEHQSASIRSSIDSGRSNVAGIRRSCSFPNSLDMSRSSGEGARDQIDPMLLSSLGSAASSHDRVAMAACNTLAAQARVMAEVTAWATPTCASAEVAEAGSKVAKLSALRCTSTASHLSEPAPSIPSCVMSARASDDCLARASEGSAQSHGALQPAAMPALSTLGESHIEKRNSQLLAASNGGVHKARDFHCSTATPRHYCGSFDVARQVQQYTAGSGAVLGAADVISAIDLANSKLPAQQSQGSAQVHSHALAMSNLYVQSCRTAKPQDAVEESSCMHAAPPVQNFPSQPTTSSKAADKHISELDGHSIETPTGVKISDVSEGATSPCSTVFGSPVLVCGFLREKNAKPCAIPEGSEAKMPEEQRAQALVFSSALFQTAPRVPAYPSTKRGGIPPNTASIHPPVVAGNLASSASPLSSPVRHQGSVDRSGDTGCYWEHESRRHRNRFAEPTTTGASPRTSTDPGVRNSFKNSRPSTDGAFETDLEMRVARSRQTMDFAARQRIRFGTLSRAELTIMDALALMDTIPRTNGQQASSQSATAYALLCAQWCVHEFPGQDWAPLVGLMHDLGRLLLHPQFGSEPAWCVTSESYPLGCRFSESISGYFFLHACPDRRCSAYAKPAGIYSSHCGLDAMHFTWTAPEYLSLVASQNGGRLPFAAMFLLRYQNFESAITEGAYSHLMSKEDVRCLPLLRKFAAIRKAAQGGAGPPRACSHTEVIARCSAAMKKYFPQPQLRF